MLRRGNALAAKLPRGIPGRAAAVRDYIRCRGIRAEEVTADAAAGLIRKKKWGILNHALRRL
jgi:hypothetical protein